MTGEILIIKRTHKEAAKKLVPVILGLNNRRPVIAISGESGSGKSVLSFSVNKLLKDQGIKAKTITSDDFYRTTPSERTKTRIIKGISNAVGPDEYDWTAINNVVTAFKSGKTITMPSVDLLNDQVDNMSVNFSPIEILILEGLYSIKCENADFRIFIDIPYTKTKAAQIIRGKELPDKTRMEILEAEHLAVAKLKTQADMIITETFRLLKNK